jgi:hypothetical protein
MNSQYKLHDFLPMYPSFEEDDANMDIYQKKEFYDYRLDRQEKKPEKLGQFMKHQIIISRFLSSHTPYTGLLLMHEPGTGKTCSSVSAIEQIRSEISTNSYNGALILMKGSNLINNYINDLVFVCTCKEENKDKKCVDGPYIPEEYHEEGITEEQKKRRINAKLKEFYQFDTFGVFSTRINKMKEEMIIKKYSNKIIVIDEVHNLRLKDEDNHYSIIHKFLHTVKNCKIILLSGTPMVDQPEEIASIMNLILPMNKQLQVEEDFVKEYMIKSDNDINILNKDKKYKLKEYLHGYVSYLKAMKSDIKKTYVGDIKLGHFNLYGLKMNDFQSRVYQMAYARDKESSEKTGVYNDSIQSSLFVYPNEMYGTEGFNQYVQEKRQKSMMDGRERTDYKITASLRDAITKDATTIEEKLNRLRKYSTIYADCIQKLLDPNDKSNHFVYIKLVKGSGAILFAKLLELFGFKESKGGFNRGLNYSIMTTSTTSDKENLDILKTFNHPSNMDGKYIKVIIGSKVVSEGITFKNVQNIHIFTPSWNFSETDQAIARGYRLFSHRDLEDAGIDVNVKIYLYCTLPSDGNKDRSIDYQMYSVSYEKDISIKSIEKAVKEASVDCALNKDRNSFSDSMDGSRECNYDKCSYKCDDVSPKYINHMSEEKLDVSTYDLYYNDKELNVIIEKIKDVFNDYNIVSITIEKLEKIISITYQSTSREMLLYAIIKMVSNNIFFVTRLDNRSFFRFDNDTLYLTYNLRNNSNFFDSYYIEHFPIQKEIDFNYKIEEIYYKNLPKVFQNLKNEKDTTKRRILLKKFPISVQEFILETCILSSELGTKGTTNLREFIIEEFKQFIERFDDEHMIISTLLFRSSESGNMRCLDISDIKESPEWKDCSEDMIEKVNERLNKKKIEIHDNEYGYYGIVNKENDKFSIVNILAEKQKVRLTKTGKVDTRRVSTGRVCATWDHEELLLLIDKIKLEYPKEFSDRYKKITDEGLNQEYDNKIFIKISKVVTRDEFYKMSRDDKLRLMYWGISGKEKINKPEICDAIEKWFKNNDLLEEKLSKKYKK